MKTSHVVRSVWGSSLVCGTSKLNTGPGCGGGSGKCGGPAARTDTGIAKTLSITALDNTYVTYSNCTCEIHHIET